MLWFGSCVYNGALVLFPGSSLCILVSRVLVSPVVIITVVSQALVLFPVSSHCSLVSRVLDQVLICYCSKPAACASNDGKAKWS